MAASTGIPVGALSADGVSFDAPAEPADTIPHLGGKIEAPPKAPPPVEALRRYRADARADQATEEERDIAVNRLLIVALVALASACGPTLAPKPLPGGPPPEVRAAARLQPGRPGERPGQADDAHGAAGAGADGREPDHARARSAACASAAVIGSRALDLRS